MAINKSKFRTYFIAAKFKQKIKITMIDVSCNFYLRKNDVTYYINLVEAIFKHQKSLLTCRELPAAAISYHVGFSVQKQVRMFHGK